MDRDESVGDIDRSDDDSSGKTLAIVLLALCVVSVLALWFSASAVVPTLTALYGLTEARAAWLSSSVSVGFVVGTLISALLTLPDRVDPRRFLMVSAFIGALANASFLLTDPGSLSSIALRLLTGACMAGVYPIGMRIAATWARRDTGLLIGIMTAAVCAGSGLPHLIDALVGLDWVITIGTASAFATLGGVLINFVRLGPSNARSTRFHPLFALRAVTDPALRLANLGYWGHKWENYAMWAWMGTFLQLSFSAHDGVDTATTANARFATYAVFMAGVPGCLLAGWLADRFGRTLVAGAALAISGSCAVLAGIFFGAAPWLMTIICLIWGFALIADSAQFSASVIELSDRTIVGTMLTVQTCIGYLITLVSIHVVQAIAATAGWRVAFATLAIGPVVGVIAMIRLRMRPEATKLAFGRR